MAIWEYRQQHGAFSMERYGHNKYLPVLLESKATGNSQKPRFDETTCISHTEERAHKS